MKEFDEELKICYENDDNITFYITPLGTLRFLRRYNKLDINIYELLKEIIDDDEEYNDLKRFLEDGQNVEQILESIPLCG